MFRNQKLVRGVTARINRAATNTLNAFVGGRAQLEPQVTDRLLGAIEQELDGKSIGGVVWVAKTLTDRVKNSQESEFGADFMGVLSLELNDFEARKGFLSQAKLVEPSQSFPTAESKRLKGQCEKMLGFSSESFVFIYSQQSGIRIIPAVEVVSARDCNPHELTSKSITEFFKDHLECFIGDRAIQSATPQGLDELRAKYEARTGIFLGGKPKSTPQKRKHELRRRISF
jgi:hypothetical protein